MGLVRKVLRAAVAQPWDYTGEGAPNDWEFRVSPDETHIALYNPNQDRWVVFHDVVVLAQVGLREMDAHTGDWRQFVSVEDPE